MFNSKTFIFIVVCLLLVNFVISKSRKKGYDQKSGSIKRKFSEKFDKKRNEQSEVVDKIEKKADEKHTRKSDSPKTSNEAVRKSETQRTPTSVHVSVGADQPRTSTPKSRPAKKQFELKDKVPKDERVFNSKKRPMKATTDAKPPLPDNIDKPKSQKQKYTTPKPFHFHQTSHHRPGDRSLDNEQMKDSSRLSQKPPKPVHQRSVSVDKLDKKSRKRSASYGDLAKVKTAASHIPRSPSLSTLNKKEKSLNEDSSHPLRRHGSRPNLRTGPTSGTSRPHGKPSTKPKSFDFSTDKRAVAKREKSVERGAKSDVAADKSGSKQIRRSTIPEPFKFETDKRVLHRRDQSADRVAKDRKPTESDVKRVHVSRSDAGKHKTSKDGIPVATERRARERSNSVDRIAKKNATADSTDSKSSNATDPSDKRKPFKAVQPRTFKIQTQPFSFDQRNQQKIKEHAHWVKEEKQKKSDQDKPQPFRAQPILCEKKGPSLPEKKVVPSTQPKEFHWQCDDRQKVREVKKVTKEDQSKVEEEPSDVEDKENEEQHGTAQVIDIQLHSEL